jgi:hypothetical protein
MSEEYCSLENDYFPSDEFYSDPVWGRVHKHDGSRPHTKMGFFIDEDPVPLEACEAPPESDEGAEW